MQLKILLKLSFLMVVFFVLASTILNQFRSNSTPLTANDTDLPMHLKIPVISVDSAIEYVGVTPSGDMDVPKNPNDVAWYKLGVRPGENGSAVIAGHFGTLKNGKGSVFDNLYKLRKGDKVYIEDDKGVTTIFIVSESRSYEPNADASAVFISNDGKPHLNLITCEGVWDEVSKSYPTRLVVFTDKE